MYFYPFSLFTKNWGFRTVRQAGENSKLRKSAKNKSLVMFESRRGLVRPISNQKTHVEKVDNLFKEWTTVNFWLILGVWLKKGRCSYVRLSAISTWAEIERMSVSTSLSLLAVRRKAQILCSKRPSKWSINKPEIRV